MPENMSMSSQTASPISRLPKQERGSLRVSALLQAAEAAIGEQGYEAATMTAIADRAGAAIGSLYQFFPTKEALAETLRSKLNDDLCNALLEVEGEAPELAPAELARS